jgi:fused signal recognition particle receptor
MFKFLKKKLKRFEEKLEEELEAELKKEEPESELALPKKEPTKKEIKEKAKPLEKPEKKAIEPEKPVKEAKKEVTKPIEKKPEKVVDKKIDKSLKKEEAEARKKKIEEEKRKRQEEIDKQIEKTIETELEHTLKTKKSIEQVVKADKKPVRRISDEKLDDLLWDLEVGLLESDVAYSVIESIKKDIKEELKQVSFERGRVGEIVEEVLKNAIANVLMSNNIDFDDLIKNGKKPFVIMFIGVNGSGKTLSIGKIATMLKKQGYSSVMAAGDTFRAGAIEQLSIHAENVGVKVIKHGPGADPAAVAFDAIDHAKAKHKDVVLLDTAGRMQTNVNLMDEMAKIKRVAKPDLIIFVGDALAGNDAVEQAKRFNETVGIDGVILTKVDTDAKGGSALSVAYTIGKPLLFIGVGQGYEDQIPFDPQWMIDNIFGKE